MSPGLKITMLLSIYVTDSSLTHSRGQGEGKTLTVNRRKCLFGQRLEYYFLYILSLNTVIWQMLLFKATYK